jgi:hypothetical protein
MLNSLTTVFTVMGIGLLCYGAYAAYLIQKQARRIKISSGHWAVSLLIYFFIIGYFVFLIHLISVGVALQTSDLLVGAVFLFGALFVVVTLGINRRFATNIIKTSEDTNRANIQLEALNKNLQEKTLALGKSEEALQKKNKELEATMEDFYTMRIAMLDKLKRGEVEEENRRIKERLDKMKMG